MTIAVKDSVIELVQQCNVKYTWLFNQIYNLGVEYKEFISIKKWYQLYCIFNDLHHLILLTSFRCENTQHFPLPSNIQLSNKEKIIKLSSFYVDNLYILCELKIFLIKLNDKIKNTPNKPHVMEDWKKLFDLTLSISKKYCILIKEIYDDITNHLKAVSFSD